MDHDQSRPFDLLVKSQAQWCNRFTHSDIITQMSHHLQLGCWRQQQMSLAEWSLCLPTHVWSRVISREQHTLVYLNRKRSLPFNISLWDMRFSGWNQPTMTCCLLTVSTTFWEGSLAFEIRKYNRVGCHQVDLTGFQIVSDSWMWRRTILRNTP